MQEYTLRSRHATTVALDQHARSVTLAALDLATGETREGRLTGCPGAAEVVAWAGWATKPLRFVYESGPCGFQLARDIRAMGVDCDVIAVSSIPRSPEDRRLKDDRRDARLLLDAVTAPAGKCRRVYVPSEEAEAARDLCRAHADMVASTGRLKLQTTAILLRHGYVWNERTKGGALRATWTGDYVDWVKSVKLPEPADDRALGFYLRAVLDGVDRCGELRKACLELSEGERFKPYVDALARLKGVDRMTALTFAATVDDFSRFRNGRSVSRYFGLTPSRHDSGERTGRGGGITKAGDATVRKAVVEGLSGLPNFTRSPKPPAKGCRVSAAVEAEADACNRRNVGRYADLTAAGKRANVAKVAVASELVRQMWAIGLMVRRELGEG